MKLKDIREQATGSLFYQLYGLIDIMNAQGRALLMRMRIWDFSISEQNRGNKYKHRVVTMICQSIEINNVMGIALHFNSDVHTR